MIFVALATAWAVPALRFPGPLDAITKPRPPPIRVGDLPKAEPKKGEHLEGRGISNAPNRRATATGNRDGRAVAKTSRKHIDSYPSTYRNDCSGFAIAAHVENGIDLSGSTRHIWERAKEEDRIHHRRPAPGDLAFFDNTYDRNRNGRRDDELSHIAVVLEVRDDGNILLAHAGTSKGRSLLHMNTEKPSVVTSDGVRYNDYLRGRRKGESRDQKFLSGELFRGYARFTD